VSHNKIFLVIIVKMPNVLTNIHNMPKAYSELLPLLLIHLKELDDVCGETAIFD
jgi:hypothetical protein